MPQRSLANFSVLGLTLLCACGGAGNPFDDAVTTPFGPIASDEAAIYAAAFDRQRSEVLGAQVTPSSEVPTAGDATFTGRAQIVVDPSSADDAMTFTGDAAMEIEFETPSVDVRLTNFTGADVLGQTLRLEGTVGVENGVIVDAERNRFVGSFSGVLLGSGVDIRATNGAFEGNFRDIPTTAASFVGVDETASYNGAPAEISLSGVAAE